MSLGNESNQYTLGKGEVYFGRFPNGTYTSAAVRERYLGNTPEFNLTIEEEKLDHYSADRGIREKDESISLQVDRTGTLVTDNVDLENVALFFFGSKSANVDAGGAIDGEFADVEQGGYYQLGVSDARPTGAKNLAGEDDDSNSAGVAPVFFDATDSNSAATPYVEGTDYEVDLARGRVYVIPGGGIVEGSTLGYTATVKAHSLDRVISGSTAVAGCLRFLAENPVGPKIDYFFPSTKLSPNGDYALKGDEWQQIPLTIEILKPTAREAIYADGQPYNP